MKYVKNIFHLILVAVLSIYVGSCQKDDISVQTDLFSPRMVSGYPIVEKNSIKYVWYEIKEAESYTIELSYDESFSDIILSENISSTVFTATGLFYDTNVYTRLKTHSSDPNHDSKWYIMKAQHTEERDIPKILHEVLPEDISNNSVRVVWDVLDDCPADLLTVSEISDNADNSQEQESQKLELRLTAAQFASGEYLIENLKESSTYEICLHNTAVPNVKEQPYNKIKVTTIGAPGGTIPVSANSDLTNLLKTGEKNPNIKDGQVYSVAPGVVLNLDGFEFTKGFVLEAQPGVTPQIVISNDFTPVGGAGLIEFRGIKLSGKEGLISSAADDARSYTFEGVVLSNCEVSGFGSRFIYMNVTPGSHKVIRKFQAENTIFNEVTSPKHLVSMDSKIDTSTSSVRIDEVLISNSTIMNSPALGGISFITDDACNYKFYVEIDHLTIFESCTSKNRVIHMNGATVADSKVIVNNLLLSNEKSFSVNGDVQGMVYQMCITKTKNKVFENNYRTKGLDEVSKSGGTVNTVMLDISQADLFDDPANGDLTIKATGSDIYTKKVGDPRWIK